MIVAVFLLDVNCQLIFFWQLAFLCLRNEVSRHEEVPEGPGYGLKSRGARVPLGPQPYVHTGGVFFEQSFFKGPCPADPIRAHTRPNTT